MNDQPTTSRCALAACSVAARNRVGCINVEDCEGAGDNLAIVLATYFSDHRERPADDKNDPETGWGEWVIEKTNRALYRIAAATSQNTKVTDAEPSTPASTRAQGPRSV